MVDEQLKEEVTTSYPNTTVFTEEEEPEGYHRQRQQQHPQSSDMGEALEQVIRLADDLQEGFLPEEKRNRVQCDAPPSTNGPAAASAASPYEGQSSREGGLLSRLFFKGNRMRHPRSRSEMHWGTDTGPAASGGGASSKDQAPWRDYAKDFQDV